MLNKRALAWRLHDLASQNLHSKCSCLDTNILRLEHPSANMATRNDWKVERHQEDRSTYAKVELRHVSVEFNPVMSLSRNILGYDERGTGPGTSVPVPILPGGGGKKSGKYDCISVFLSDNARPGYLSCCELTYYC